MKAHLKPQWVGNGLSAALHGGLLLALLAASGLTPEEPRKLSIDFRLETTRPAAPGASVAHPAISAPAAPAEAEPEPLPREQPQNIMPREIAARPMKRAAQKPKPTPSPEPQPRPVLASSPQPEAVAAEADEASATELANLLAVQPAAGGNTTAGRMAASPPHAGTEDGDPEPPDERYRRQHFDHIRDNLQGKIQYPVLARRKGWEGRVVVAFTVCQDGSVSNAKIVESSGFPLLDNSALATIREAAPLPRPPIQAELVIPIVFRLS